jgi:hypothetical protein
VPELSWLIGAAGGVVVFVLTTVTAWVVRMRQRGRELRGLSRVLRPEMERNSNTIGILAGPAGFERGTYLDDPPTRDAWLDTRVRLSELMQEDDFANLARFYAALELLATAVTREDPLLTEAHLGEAAEHGDSAMQVVEGYCNAQWRPFKGPVPGPLRDGGWGGPLLSPQPPEKEATPTEASGGAQEATQRPWWRRVFRR